MSKKSRKRSPQRPTDPQRREPAGKKRRTRGWRLWAFRFVALFVIPAAFIVAVELGLGLFGYGVSMDFTYRAKIDGREIILSNRFFTRRFFDPRIAREPLPFALPAEKGPQTCRVFVGGGSAAQGDPEPSFGIARLLEVMLREEYPGVDFEVVNGGITAINSHTVLPVVRDCVELDPDLMVVYMGNNETTGPYGPGSVFSPLLSHIFLIRAKIALQGTRIGQLVKNLTYALEDPEKNPKRWKGMKMFLENRVRASDPRMEKVYEYFERNLEDIRKACRKSGTPLVISTVSVNLRDCPPLASLHRTDLSPEDTQKWEAIYSDGITLEKSGDLAGAVNRYREALAIDSDFADLQFRLARCSWDLEDFVNAREHYVKARELDVLRFRTDTRTNDVIRSVASVKTEAPLRLADASKAIKENSPHGVPGREMFYEHVHLTFHGNYLATRTVFEQACAILPDRIRRNAANRPPLSEEDCARRLAYTGWDRYRILSDVFARMNQPPFTNQLYHDERVKALSDELSDLAEYAAPGKKLDEAVEEYETAFREFHPEWSADMRYASLNRTFRIDMTKAVTHSRIVVEKCPHNWLEYRNLGIALAELGRRAEAEEAYRESLRISPDQYESYIGLSLLRLDEEKTNESIEYGKLAVVRGANSADALSNMSALLYLKEDYPQAVDYARRALDVDPYSVSAHLNLANALVLLPSDEEANRAGAIGEYQAILRMNPRHDAARQGLAWVFYEQAEAAAKGGRFDEARGLLEKALEANPDFSDAHRTLAGILIGQGDKAGAILHLSEYIRLNPNDQTAPKILEELGRR